MGDAWAVALAVAAATGSWVATPLPRWPAIVLAVVGIAARRPALLCVAVLIGASALGARAWAGLEPAPRATMTGAVTLVGDPAWRWGGVRAEASAGSRRVELSARGPTAWRLADRAAGERVWVRGRLTPVGSRERRWLAPHHVGTRLEVSEVGGWASGPVVSRAANGLRRTIAEGAASLPQAERALFTGMVFGDDREQPPAVTARFRAAGLTHLLAVSGGNVAFVLAICAPLLARCSLRLRLIVGIAVLVGFGVATRWEPSVSRAVAMAALAMVTATSGRSASGVRLLGLAVTGLLLLDPLLVRSAGFALSVGASAGIALAAAPIARALPLPRWLALPVAVTGAAQLGVAPVLLPMFGPIALATIPANLLAVPAAGPVMAWGVLAGVPAGLVGERVAVVLHLPTRLLVGWVHAVAKVAAAHPIAYLRWPHLVGAAAVAVALVWHRHPR